MVKTEFLEQAPINKYQKMLLTRIDIQEEKLVDVAKELGKTKGTVSIQHKRALQKYYEWIESQCSELRELDIIVSDIAVVLGRWSKIIDRLFLEETKGKLKSDTCFYNIHNICKFSSFEEKPSRLLKTKYIEKENHFYLKATPEICGQCMTYVRSQEKK